MNQVRRSKIVEALAILEEVRDGEQDAYDNMPESIQAGERGDKSQEAIDALENAINELEGIE